MSGEAPPLKEQAKLIKKVRVMPFCASAAVA